MWLPASVAFTIDESSLSITALLSRSSYRVLLSVAFVNAQALELANIIPNARVNDVDGVDETFIPPLIAPNVPARLYFRFGKPVSLTRSMKDDREAADKEYAGVKVCVCVAVEKEMS